MSAFDELRNIGDADAVAEAARRWGNASAAHQGGIDGRAITPEGAPSHTTPTGSGVCCCRPLWCVVPVLLDAGQAPAPWVVPLGAGQLQVAGFQSAILTRGRHAYHKI